MRLPVTPTIEAGTVFLPELAPWLDAYVDELSSFPAAQHDDQTDSTAQALNYFRGSAEGSGVIDFYDQQIRKVWTKEHGAAEAEQMFREKGWVW